MDSRPASPRAPERMRPLTVLALLAIPLILILLGSLLSTQFEQTRQLREQVDASYRMRFQIQRLLSLHQDVETGYRGYVLTGTPAFLEPYERANGEIEPAFQRIERSFAADDPTHVLFHRLRARSAAKLAFARQLIALRRAGPVGDVDALLERGKALMDAIRGEIAAMDEAERTRLMAITQEAERARQRGQQTTFILLAGLGVLLFAAAFAHSRSTRAERRALAQVRNVSARQIAIFESAKDGMITLNLSGSIETLNPAAARMFGFDADALLNRDIGTLFEIAPDQGKIETFLKRLERRSAADANAVQEFRGRRSDGSIFPVDVSVSPVPLEDGLRFVAVVRDATERKQVEQMKNEFVSTVSHELRTPLTSIAGSLGLLTGGAAGALPDKAVRLIKIAHSNCERLVRLINDILDIEKIETGALEFSLASLPLRPLLEQVVEANRGFAGDYGVEVELLGVPDDAIVIADPDRLTQVVTNLLSNAIKFSPRGERVTLSVSPLDRRYRISVRDRGPGIPEEFRGRIFGKFAQADSSDTRQKGGTGLGLSIVREIVTRLGGSISFEAAQGGGTIFHADIPAEQRRTVTLAGEPGQPRLLHVEDDADVLRVVASAFEGRGRLQHATTLAAARALVERETYDVILLDIALPDGSGLDLLPVLQSGRHGRPSVVLFTAQDSPMRVPDGIDAVLTKSRASLDRLVETVSTLLAKRPREDG